MRAFWISLLLVGAITIAWSFWPATVEPVVSETTLSPAPEEPPPSREPEMIAAADRASIGPAAPEESTAPIGVAADEASTATPGLAEPAEAPTAATAEPLPLGLEASIPEATVIAGSILPGPKGLLLADDRFEIEGAGTREDPYRVSWELLVSAGESYRPRVGDRGIPQRIAMLDGQWVSIDGYVAFPMLVGTTSEALVMLNRWDGCCIGVPPSPYDAIEVKLDRPVVRTQMHAIDYGAVVGVLEVEPYLIDDWLVGLYLMDEASLKLDL